ETQIGTAIAPLDRARLFLTSKVLPSNASYDGTLAACERSLTRLGTSYLDLYLLHWPSPTPFRETARALRRLRDEGLVRYVGVSNFDLEELVEARNLLDDLACNQVLYHLRERGMEHRVLPFAREHGIAIVGYTPFGRGSYRRSGSEVLDAIAQWHGATTSQVILAFLTRDPDLYAIPKAARRAHMLENAGALDLRLSDEDIVAIDRSYPRGDDAPLATL
ncbi:MAG: aldo/keto reductase, partial [Vulcanimicrobiaceae bacterium]